MLSCNKHGMAMAEWMDGASIACAKAWKQICPFLQGQRWGSCEDLSLLDAEGAELLLIGARHEPPKGAVRYSK